jgi:hypothetical protein
MTNTNCLENTKCPECDNADRLFIESKTLAVVTDDGAETFGDMEWDDDSYAECPECRHSGKLREFRHPEPTLNQSATDETSRLIEKQLTSSGFVHTPGLFRYLQHDYRIQGEPRRRSIRMLSEGYGLPPEEAEALLSGAIAIKIDEAVGTITYTVAQVTAEGIQSPPADHHGTDDTEGA